MPWLYVLPVLALCAFAVYFTLRRRKSDSGSMSPVVRSLLDQAVEQGSYMSVNFEAQEADNARFLGPCPQFDAETMLLDIGLSKEHPEWAGEVVLVSFRLDNKNLSSYYQFASRIQGMRRRHGSYCLALETPSEILSSQKRRFVRIHPPSEAILGLGVWSFDDDAPRLNRPSDLGKALFSYREGKEGPLSLVDVSAAGLRISILRKEGAEDFDVQAGTRLMCLLMLLPVKGDVPLSFWLDCTVSHREEQANPATMLFGLNFSAWAIAQPGKNFVEWSLAGENGWVGPLGTWVWHQQLAHVARNVD